MTAKKEVETTMQALRANNFEVKFFERAQDAIPVVLDMIPLDASIEMLQGRVRAYARIRNALDEDYEESFGFPQPGRTYVLGGEWRL